MTDRKYYIIFLGILSLIIILICSIRTIVPFVASDEYYKETVKVDKNISYTIIHSDNCPGGGSAWFSRKYNKYDILLKCDEEICSECLGWEEEKLMILHKLNLKEEVLRLRRAGASDDYINNELKQYQ